MIFTGEASFRGRFKYTCNSDCSNRVVVVTPFSVKMFPLAFCENLVHWSPGGLFPYLFYVKSIRPDQGHGMLLYVPPSKSIWMCGNLTLVLLAHSSRSKEERREGRQGQDSCLGRQRWVWRRGGRQSWRRGGREGEAGDPPSTPAFLSSLNTSQLSQGLSRRTQILHLIIYHPSCQSKSAQTKNFLSNLRPPTYR